MTEHGGFRPAVLREHSLIADGERGAVIGPHGNILWMCVPRWHDEPVFAALIGGLGHYTVTPSDSWNVWGGSYLPGSLIWCGRWVTTHSIIECEDSLSYPGDREAAVILRRIRAVSGPARVTVSCQPSSGFDSHLLSEAQKADGVWTGQVDDVRMRWQGAADAQLDTDGCLRFDLELEQGEEHTLALELSRSPLPETPVDAAELLESTYRSWDRTVAEVDRPGTNADILQSYAVLAGLTSRDNGMVAAVTMSLPERPKAHRDYDYRYAWIRDQCYVGQAVAQLGPNPLLEAALTFVSDRINEHGTDLKPAYRVDGGDLPDEHRVGLLGYPGGTNIAGNWVNDQFQLDTPGEALNLFAKAADLDRMNGRRWRRSTPVCASSKTAGSAPTRVCGSSKTGIGRTPASHASPVCAASPGTPRAVKPPAGRLSPRRSWPISVPPRTPRACGSSCPTERERMRRSFCLWSAERFRPTIPAQSRR
jgi:hypothetical protein